MQARQVPESALAAAFKPFTNIQGPLSVKYRLLQKEFAGMNQVMLSLISGTETQKHCGCAQIALNLCAMRQHAALRIWWRREWSRSDMITFATFSSRWPETARSWRSYRRSIRPILPSQWRPRSPATFACFCSIYWHVRVLACALRTVSAQDRGVRH